MEGRRVIGRSWGRKVSLQKGAQSSNGRVNRSDDAEMPRK